MLYLFIFLGLFTPGPNVILLTASGARFGFRRTMPHVIGVALGVGIIAAVAGLGVSGAILAVPGLAETMKILAAAWILWMAWGLISSASTPEAREGERPFTAWQAVLFQWINAKVWAVVLAASAGYPSELGPVGEAARLATAFSGINLFVCLFWTLAGSMLAYLLATPRAWATFRFVMGILLAGSAGMVFL